MRLLTQQDESALRALLQGDPLYNLFMIGDLDWLGLGTEELLFWGQFSPQADLIGVAMRYYGNWCFYARSACNVETFAPLVDDYPKSGVITGHPDQVGPIVAQLEAYTVGELHDSIYCRMSLDTPLPAAPWPTRRATLADVNDLVELYADAGMLRRDAHALSRTMEAGRIFVTEVGDRFVSAALTSIEATHAAMVGGVFTPEPLRNRGYASAALTHLCAELIAEGKQPCLFYDNPKAGSIYRRLGFEDIGPWHMVLLESER
jgi:predicted GNAT family acetyltransferase